MKFEYLSNDRIKVTLSAADLSEAGIDLENSDQADIKKLKSYLFFLFSKINLPSDYTEDENGTLYIEIYPRPNGGATVYFIIDRKSRELCEPSVFCFYNADDAVNAATVLYSNCSHRIYKSALYRCGICWLLVICPLDGHCGIAEKLLSEYGERVCNGSITAAAIEEHCKPVIRERAVDMISFYFG